MFQKIIQMIIHKHCIQYSTYLCPFQDYCNELLALHIDWTFCLLLTILLPIQSKIHLIVVCPYIYISIYLMMTMYYTLQTFGYTKGPAPIAHAASTLLHWLSFSGASSDPHGPSQIGNSSRTEFLLDDEVESQWNTSIWCTTCSFPGVMIASYFCKRTNYMYSRCPWERLSI